MDEKQVALREPLELDVSEVSAQVAKIQKLMASVMKKDEHYGVIPGTKGKPTLLKAGAEKLGFTFRLVATFDIKRGDLPNGHREYDVVCTLTHQITGAPFGQGVGSCSTMEKKYRYRWQNGNRVENTDIADSYNTVLKMAKKRAHVDAMITACAASDIFTQDVEDMEIHPAEPVPEPKPEKRMLSQEEAAVLQGMGAVLKNVEFTEADRERFRTETAEILARQDGDRIAFLKSIRKEIDDLYLSRKKPEKMADVIDQTPDVEPEEQTELEVF